MPLQFFTLDQVKKNTHPAVFTAGVKAELQRILGATVMQNISHDKWGNVATSGSCRAGVTKAGKKDLVTCSEFKVHHAEENLHTLMGAEGYGATFDVMYVDIEPCHSGRYKDHDCKLFLTNHYTSGLVFYAFDQDTYAKGEVGKILRNMGAQDQATYLRSLAGFHL